MKTLIFTVTNDLVYDQRMQRICSSLSKEYKILLVGRQYTHSPQLKPQTFKQFRLSCFFRKGIFFYTEYNIRLFIFLLSQKANLLCAIDLDTIIPVYVSSILKRAERVYDAHELFTEQKEIVTRPFIHAIWKAVEKFCVPLFKYGYTVNTFIADELRRRYRVNYAVIQNLPLQYTLQTNNIQEKFIIYQGAVNEGRSFETLIPAMKNVNAKLKILGIGNYFKQVEKLIVQHKVEDKVELKGAIAPGELRKITSTAHIGITIFENKGLNQFYSLSNRFFDYIMAAVPQVCVNYPEYKKINDEFHVAYMIDDVAADTISSAFNILLSDEALHDEIMRNCLHAREKLNWEKEELRLLHFYKNILERN